MPLVLAIEPDLRQATIVKRIVREKVLADVAVVDSRDAALEAIRLAMPDVLLISALLSPRDEDELIAHLRTVDNAGHLQTHTIPQLASALMPDGERASGGLLSAFRRKKKKEPEVAPGCDPDIFAEEIRSYLQRAAEKKRERIEGEGRQDSQDHAWRAARPQAVTADPEPAAAAEPSGPSSWASPFEWKPASTPSSVIAHPESPIAPPEPRIARPESPIAHPEEPPSLMAHLRPPSGVTSLKALRESLAAEAEGVAAPAEAPRPAPEIEIVEVAAATPDPKPIMEAAPIQEAEPVQEVAIVLEAAPIAEAAEIQEASPAQEPAPIAAAARLSTKDSGSGIKDQGLGIRDKGFGIRDSRLGALASWARAERAGHDAAEKADDMYGVLLGLAVPPAVVAVGYGRGCRIRRVRVLAAHDPVSAEPVGPVILSRRVLDEQREHRGV